MREKHLVLIDGHALAYRMFYALPIDRFSTRSGEPTNATFGFVRTLMDIVLDENPPEYLAVSFDVGKTFRDDLFAEYKATRAKTPDELHVQVDRIREVVTAFNIPILEVEGFEADDVLGTIAEKAGTLDVSVSILTGDRDLLQLVNEYTTIMLAGRSGTMDYHASQVFDKFGIRPDQVVDYKALVGDASDNIPGVRGVGDKTAVKLLQKYDTLDRVYENVQQVKSARFRNALIQGRESAYLSQKLARIVTDVPLDWELEACRTQDFDRASVAGMLRDLEFRTLADRLRTDRPFPGKQLGLFETGAKSAPAAEATSAPETTRSHVVLNNDQLSALVDQLEKAEFISFDTETTGTDEMSVDLVGIAISTQPGAGFYIPVGHQLPDDKERQLDLETVLDALRPAFTNPSIPKLAHNAKYDVTILHRYGLKVSPVLFDTMLAAWLLEPSSRGLGLKNQAWMRLGIEMTEITHLIGSGRNQITMAEVSIDKAASYAAADVDVPLRLKEILAPELVEKQLWDLYERVEMPLIPIISDMEQAGVLIDKDVLTDMSADLAVRLEALQVRAFDLAKHPFNLNSTQQLSKVLFEELGLPTEGLRKTKSGFYSTAADVLESLKGTHDIIDLILDNREISKLKSTYVDALPDMVNAKTGRIHTSYNQAGAVTGRIASSNPNLQNIPIRTPLGRQVRRAFIAQPGFLFLAADYSQVELRVLAHISQDEALLDAFRQGQDIHATTAATVYRIPLQEVTKDQRRFAKSVNFGLLYGMSAFRLARESDLTLGEAEDFVQAYFDSFPRVREYLEGTIQQAGETGFVETIMGRRRYFPVLQQDASGRSMVLARQRAEREAVNFPIQGSAADIIKIAMINLYRALAVEKFRAKMILQVHDELVLEVPSDEIDAVKELVTSVMSNAYDLAIELQVDSKIGHNWMEMD